MNQSKSANVITRVISIYNVLGKPRDETITHTSQSRETHRLFSFQKFLKNSRSKEGDLSLADFIYYVREHEKNLRLHFSHLDTNKDGK